MSCESLGLAKDQSLSIISPRFLAEPDFRGEMEILMTRE
jgi:hypothetical protein